MSKTTNNLKDAFAGESQANRKYLAFAKKADAEGYHQVAKLFRAAAESETIHALYHFNVMKGVSSTADNLKAAMEGEAYEHTTMYPGFIAEAEKEGMKDAVIGFKAANAVEIIHDKKFGEAAVAVKAGKDQPTRKLYVCPICGNVHEDEPPAACAICGAKGNTWKEIL
ncbi:MAG: rubrerythrin family protein [Methanomassiliicoccales archaeon]